MVDLWPKDISEISIKSPVAILREQASLLGQKTKGLVTAEVKSVSFNTVDYEPSLIGETDEVFTYGFFISAPSLNYASRLFVIMHGINLYPVTVIPDIDVIAEGDVTATSEEEFLEILKIFLGSEKTKQIISSLLAQVDLEHPGIPF